jgi:hypothetical protein
MTWNALLVVALMSTPIEQVLDARARAYEANFHNDAGALRRAAQDLSGLANDAAVGAMASYYAAWTEWMLAASELEAGRPAEATHAAERATAHARRALARNPEDVECVTMLANTLISVVVLDRPRLPALAGEIRQLRAQALALGPANPRVAMMDAGMIFNNPPERGGGKEKGLARWLEAIELFGREAGEQGEDPLRPRWGRDLAYGWLAELYLAVDPPQQVEAHAAAAMALKLRPDFWYVKERVLPRLLK